jgi:hypothetical protein
LDLRQRNYQKDEQNYMMRRSKFILFSNYYQSGQMKVYDIGGAFSMHGENKLVGKSI